MKLYFIVCMLSMSLISCEKEELQDSCGSNNPSEELSWLREIIAEHTLAASRTKTHPAAAIYKYTYQTQTYFLVNLCVGCPDGTYEVYNCKGEIFCYGGGITGETTCGDFHDKAMDEQLIWKN